MSDLLWSAIFGVIVYCFVSKKYQRSNLTWLFEVWAIDCSPSFSITDDAQPLTTCLFWKLTVRAIFKNCFPLLQQAPRIRFFWKLALRGMHSTCFATSKVNLSLFSIFKWAIHSSHQANKTKITCLYGLHSFTGPRTQVAGPQDYRSRLKSCLSENKQVVFLTCHFAQRRDNSFSLGWRHSSAWSLHWRLLLAAIVRSVMGGGGGGGRPTLLSLIFWSFCSPSKIM